MSKPTIERNKIDANVYVDRAIAMLKDEILSGRINTAAYNGTLSLLQYAKESHAASLHSCGGWAVRPSVKWFAEQMEAALKRNDHKGGWLNDTWDELHDRLLEEAKELRDECNSFPADKEAIVKEATDVANFAMMIADIYGKKLGQTPFDESLSCDVLPSKDDLFPFCQRGNKWFYCYKDTKGLNQHSKLFDSWGEAIQSYSEWHFVKPDDLSCDVRLQEAGKEIERLKGLMIFHVSSMYDGVEELGDFIQRFKTENNL